ncbi:MAG: histidine kinase [Gammaproteobacteria bacterium]|nr:histidine kinase [Gammaproteobacteria bacterium]
MNAEPSIPPAQHLYWWCQLLGWGLFGAASFFPLPFIDAMSWGRAAAAASLTIALGIALSHALRLLIRQRGWRGLRLIRRVPRILAASLLLGVAGALLRSALGLSPPSEPVTVGATTWQPPQFLIDTLNLAAVFVLWSAVYFGVLAVREHKSRALREAELARALQASELRLLKSQLNPHFLFNALNSVRALIADEPARAQSAVTELARTLRYTLSSGQGELVTLEQELATVQDYLALEALRLGERLRLEIDVAAEARKLRIPVMLLQTLVENAIKHGIAELPAGGVLRISARTAGATLQLEVENPRPEGRSEHAGEGIGIANAQRRLHLLFGPDATLHLDLSQRARALARVSLPLSA